MSDAPTPPEAVLVRVEVGFTPFSVPRYVHRADTLAGTSGTPIEELPIEVVDALVKRWLNNVYAQCGKPNLWIIPPTARR